MPILRVLVNDKGDVVGTARAEVTPSGSGAPTQAAMIARPGQHVVELDVDDATAALDPTSLHDAVRSQYARPGAAKSGGPGQATRAKIAKAAKSASSAKSAAGKRGR
jgi:hypothetical protein